MRNDKNQWNPDSPENFEKYLLEEQKVTLRYGMDVNGTVEWINGGVFWLSEWSTPSNGMEASFTARDAFTFMTDVYTGTLTGTLYDIAVAALNQTNQISTLEYIVHDSLKSISTDLSSSNPEYTVAQVLQLVAHAGCCVLYQDREGVIHVEPRSDLYSGYMIEPDICYSHPEYEIGKPLRALSVAYGEDQKVVVSVANRGETQTIENPMIQTEEDARAVAEAARNILTNRKVISGDYRSDMRLDVLDNIIVVSKYASNIICVTDVTYSTTGGGIKGTYRGRVSDAKLNSVKRYSGEFYSNEI